MSEKTKIVNEFNRRVFEESYVRIAKCLIILEEKDIWKSPSIHIPSIGNLVLHLCGNARQWILAGIGGKMDNRNRDQEFVKQENIRKSDLIFLLENMKTNIRHVLQEMPESKLNQPMIIQGFQETGFSVLVHVIEHFSYHTGQITTLTKLFSGKETDFYSGMNLNQLN
jgi:uncharacterized damage-inducible protein DinB